MDDLTREFLLESQEGLDRMERCLTDLESRPGDTGLLSEIFRSVHTIKGTTGFLGFGRLESLAHAGENLLGLLREGSLAASPENVSGLLALMDMLRGILRSIETTGSEGESQNDDRAMIERLETLQSGSATAGQPEAAAVAAAVPEIAELAATPQRRKRSQSRRSGGRTTGPAAPAPEPAEEVMPTQSLPLPEAGESAGPLPSWPAAASAHTSGGPGICPEAPTQSAGQKLDSAPSSSTADSTLRVEIELLNRMMNLVGELVLTRNQILQATSSNAGFALLGRRLDMVTADLRESVMKARMQPVSHVFSRFPRLVRDLARGLNKRIRLEMEGQETELDKSLLEAIRDPLTHAIRNSIDHGIEMPAARRAAGKPEEGVLRLRACHEGGHVVVEVQDDGAGMDLRRIREKAVERGLVPAARAEQMGEREILQLIFLPGFSTAAAVTSISGRGVGMDVVRTNVEKIGGKVDVESRAGEGTVLRLRIPLTLAIIPALIVRSCGQSFAVPQSALTELVHLSAPEAGSRIEWMENAPLFRLRGQLLPLVFLDRLLGQPAGDSARACDIAVLNADGRRFGLIVDGLADPEEIVVKPLAPILREIGYYAGATILGSGKLALILNPGAIAQITNIGLSAETVEQADENRGDTAEYLLVEAQGRPAALPLETVVRIERIPPSRIEIAGSRPVLRFEGNLLPLDDAAGEPGAESASATTVVICRDGERQIGMTVDQVLDVTGGSRLEEAGTAAHAQGVALLKDRVTRIVSLSTIPSLDREPGFEFPVSMEAEC